MNEWYSIENINEIDSPALVVYPERVKQNIDLALQQVGGHAGALRPHVKTSKMAEVCRMMMEAGITKFKCATIAEAEMLALEGAPDVLLAYQPVGPKMTRFLRLVQTYPETVFSCLIDNVDTAQQLAALCRQQQQVRLRVYIDINVGMNRTGVSPGGVLALAQAINDTDGITLAGLHAYDGHLRDSDLQVRQAQSDAAFMQVEKLRQAIQEQLSISLTVVVGGTPTFPTHSRRAGVECSPGTFVFWDWGYQHQLPDEPFQYAALLLTRVISVLDEYTVCTDLGHKSVAAENPLPRVYFLNAPLMTPVAQSEEHLVLKTTEPHRYIVGDLFYGVPVHICPTVALYDKAWVVQNGRVSGTWNIVARNRAIHI